MEYECKCHLFLLQARYPALALSAENGVVVLHGCRCQHVMDAIAVGLYEGPEGLVQHVLASKHTIRAEFLPELVYVASRCTMNDMMDRCIKLLTSIVDFSILVLVFTELKMVSQDVSEDLCQFINTYAELSEVLERHFDVTIASTMTLLHDIHTPEMVLLRQRCFTWMALYLVSTAQHGRLVF